MTMIIRNPCLSADDARKASALDLRSALLSDPAISYAGYSRGALLHILKLLGLRPGAKVLVPAYICDVVLLPLAALGLEPVYYGITDRFQIDPGNIPVPPGAAAIITVNYFGWSLDYAAIASFTEGHGLLWINDNAHGYASRLARTPLERFGDVSITSFRKVLPTVNGSRIIINNPRYLALKPGLDELNAADPDDSPLPFLLRTALCRTGLRLRRLPDYSDIRGFADRDPGLRRIHERSIRTLLACDESGIRTRRRELFRTIAAFLASRGNDFVEPVVTELPDGNSPLVVPLRVNDSRAWAAILRAGRDHGFDVHTWPSLPAEARDRNQFRCADQWRTHLFLPLHQDIVDDDYLTVLERVLHAARDRR